MRVSERPLNLNNYFYSNYCKAVPSGANLTTCSQSGTVSGETSISVQPTTDITAATVTYSATATVPTTFMRLVGVNSLSVSVTSQTTKFPGMEITLVLDNTGSMLCGDSDGGSCGLGVVTNDTSCSNESNHSRICTLRNAAKSFVTTIQQAISGPQSIYISIVPYVTNVNVGPSFCTGAASCSNITTDAASGAFTDLRGYIMPVVQFTGSITGSNSTVSNVSMATPGGSVSGTAAVQESMYIFGPGIPNGTRVSDVNSGSLTLTNNTTLPYSNGVFAVGPNPNVINATAVSNADSANPTFIMGTQITGRWSSSNTNVTHASTTTGAVAGMYINASNATGFKPSTEDTISSVNSGTSTIVVTPTRPSANQTSNASIDISDIKGSITNGSTSLTGITFRPGSSVTMSTIVPGMEIVGNGIASSTIITAVNAGGSSLTLSKNATRTGQAALLLGTMGGTAKTGQTTLTNVKWDGVPITGNVITGIGIPVNTTIIDAPSTVAQYAAGSGTLAISNAATSSYNAELNSFKPITYDSAYNTASPSGSSTTVNWGGCVIESTSSSEHASDTGVLAVSGTPDVSEPVAGTKWYPMYWVPDSSNSWTTSGTAQDAAHETQGNLNSEWLSQDGPNQGCTVPILPLTDLTTDAGLNSINSRIDDMWSRASGGTFVHVGMAWGWRTLASTGPFTANNGHPLSYSTAQSQGWKKIIILMTDGENEWPASDDLTGLGQVADGKGGSTSTSTAATNLDTRLASICTAMKASETNGQKNFIIYTIGLASGGQSNTNLSSCAGNGGSYYAANTDNLNQKFQDIANSIAHLRLAK